MPDATHDRDGRGPGTRTKARKRALDILFEAELREGDPLVTLADRIALGEPPVRPFTIELVEGVQNDLPSIDQVIADSLTAGWTLERMPLVDRNLARIAVYEMFYTDLAPEIAINEAVDLAGDLSTDDSPAFLNGMLGKALQTLRETYPAVEPDADAETPDAPDAETPVTEPDADSDSSDDHEEPRQ